MAVEPTFTDDEIDAIRSYCEAQLRDEVARLAVVKRDMGACIGLIVELMDGHRVACIAEADGHDDAVGRGMVAEIRRQATERREAMH